MNRTYLKVFFVTLIGLLLLAGVVMLVWRFLPLGGPSSLPGPTSELSNPLYSNQTAQIQGKILQVQGNNLIVQNNQGVKGEVVLAKNFLIYNMDSGTQFATPSSDIKRVETGKDLNLLLQVKDGHYQVTSINYPLPMVSPASPISTKSALPSVRMVPPSTSSANQ